MNFTMPKTHLILSACQEKKEEVGNQNEQPPLNSSQQTNNGPS